LVRVPSCAHQGSSSEREFCESQQPGEIDAVNYPDRHEESCRYNSQAPVPTLLKYGLVRAASGNKPYGEKSCGFSMIFKKRKTH
jgi:hypothetical protein